jgi:ketosteroid isomerase-like protein
MTTVHDDGTDVALSVSQGRASFREALQRGDSLTAAELYAADARLVAPSAELLIGRQAIERFWRAGVEAGISEIVFEPLELTPEGSVACEIGRYELRLQPVDGAVIVDRGRYVMLHRLDADGTWRRAVEMLSPDTPSVRPLLDPPATSAGSGARS